MVLQKKIIISRLRDFILLKHTQQTWDLFKNNFKNRLVMWHNLLDFLVHEFLHYPALANSTHASFPRIFKKLPQLCPNKLHCLCDIYSHFRQNFKSVVQIKACKILLFWSWVDLSVHFCHFNIFTYDGQDQQTAITKVFISGI